MLIELNNGRPHVAERLLPCTDWDKAEFRYPNPIKDWKESRAIACNVKITGEQIVPRLGGFYKRGMVTWVGDGEPDSHCKCWIPVFWDGEVIP